MRKDEVNTSKPLTLTLLMWRIWWAPNNASKWQMEFDLAFKGLSVIFIGQCIVIYSYITTYKMQFLSQIICSCKTLYMFRTVFPSIIRSSKLCVQQRYMSNNCCYLLLSGNEVAAAVWHIPLLYTQFWAPDDGRKDRPKHIERFTRINNLR